MRRTKDGHTWKNELPTHTEYLWSLAYRKGGMTSQEWITWWTDTGKWSEHGQYRGQYYMSRIDKTEPFSLDNVELRQYGKKK
jgi:hypothetical protein